MRAHAIALGLVGPAWAAGCITEVPPLEGTQSLAIELVTPTSGGAIDDRLPDSARAITINIRALDQDGALDPSFDRDVSVHVQFLGTLTPALGTIPLAMLRLTAGEASGQTINLPAAYGPTTLWVDDGQHESPTYATGTSPTLWYRDPYVADVQRPVMETALDALERSPLENKQVRVGASRYGARGRLVVTSVFAQGYTVSDVECSDPAGTPPCTAQAYDHAMVFSFSAPRDIEGNRIELGQVIAGFAGGVVDFNGLTEIGFPQTFTNEHDVDPARIPAPVVLDPDTWFDPLSSPDGRINFERNEAGAIQIDNGLVCALDDDFATYKQWKIDPDPMGDCTTNRVINVITAGTVTEVDPAALVGMRLPQVVGILRPVNIGSFNVWIIYPRSAGDVVLP